MKQPARHQNHTRNNVVLLMLPFSCSLLSSMTVHLGKSSCNCMVVFCQENLTGALDEDLFFLKVYQMSHIHAA